VWIHGKFKKTQFIGRIANLEDINYVVDPKESKRDSLRFFQGPRDSSKALLISYCLLSMPISIERNETTDFWYVSFYVIFVFTLSRWIGFLECFHCMRYVFDPSCTLFNNGFGLKLLRKINSIRGQISNTNIVGFTTYCLVWHKLL